MYDEDQIIELLTKIQLGEISVYRLPEDLYFLIGEDLEKKINRGFGKALSDLDYGTPEYEAMLELKRNTYKFSAAKTFQQVRAFEKLSKKAGYFEKGAADFDKYNRVWQDVEGQLAERTARATKKWQRIEEIKEIKPLLKYQTAGDERVRISHAALDNIVKPVDDPFWDIYAVPNGYNCRCIIISVSDEKTTKTDKLDLPELDTLFKMNPGKDKFAMKKHPYYKVPKRYNELKKKNFDLPLPKDVI